MPTDKLRSHFTQNRATRLKRGDSQGVKAPPANAGDVRDVGSTPWGWEDPLEEEMATYSSILAQRIPWTEEPGGLQSMVGQSQAQSCFLKELIVK